MHLITRCATGAQPAGGAGQIRQSHGYGHHGYGLDNWNNVADTITSRAVTRGAAPSPPWVAKTTTVVSVDTFCSCSDGGARACARLCVRACVRVGPSMCVQILQ